MKHVIVWEHSATGFHIKYYDPLSLFKFIFYNMIFNVYNCLPLCIHAISCLVNIFLADI